MSELLPAIELETAPNPQCSVIWLHGLGADGNDFVPIVPELGLSNTPAVRFIFPHAPMIPVTFNNGYVMRAWYDLDNNRQASIANLRASIASVRALITRENARGVPTSRIVLAGFSQGAAMAYTVGLTYPETLAGIVALSAYLPVPDLLMSERSDANRHTPIFAAHGTQDEVLPLQMGTQACDFLLQHGYTVNWFTYRMPHAVCPEEIADIGEWLTTRLQASCKVDS